MSVDLVDQEIDESMCEVREMEIEKSTVVQTMVISGTDVGGTLESRGYRNIQRSRDVDRLGKQWRSDDRRKHGVHGSVRQGWLDLISAYLFRAFWGWWEGGTFIHSCVRFFSVISEEILLPLEVFASSRSCYLKEKQHTNKTTTITWWRR